jgi:hypothetical protein
MWLLTCEDAETGHLVFGLLPGETYRVGRFPGQNADIGNSSDCSISRKHGTVTVEAEKRATATAKVNESDIWRLLIIPGVP